MLTEAVAPVHRSDIAVCGGDVSLPRNVQNAGIGVRPDSDACFIDAILLFRFADE